MPPPANHGNGARFEKALHPVPANLDSSVPDPIYLSGRHWRPGTGVATTRAGTSLMKACAAMRQVPLGSARQ